MVKILNVGTKKANGCINAYRRAYHRTLSDCYANWSLEKERAYDYCLHVLRDLDGDDLKITGFNANFFTVMFKFERDGETWLRIETYANSYETKYC